MQKKPNPKSRPHPVRPALTHQIRIIGGKWKRTPLPVLAADGLRPTPDRVRETVFNWLTHLRDGHWDTVRCLDLFAGTGALGFEAASRGAARVLMVEENTAATRQLEATRDKLQATQIEVVRGNALTVTQNLITRSGEGQFDLIFLDPPYHQDWLAKMLPTCRRLLAKDGVIYVEAEAALIASDEAGAAAASPAWLDGWAIVRADRAGVVFYHLLQSRITPLVEA
ncbi:MAG: 16S rRNA (guanine(966)-N(2))-methyltransferase RsmD [Herminiimonas sp.]|nr:16S rRNA (guanine(966)-N(2))-methyltransferase RsmD [Herminiimonas sp.]